LNSRVEDVGEADGMPAQRSENGVGGSTGKEPAVELEDDASSMRTGKGSKENQRAVENQGSNVLDGVVLPGVEVRIHRRNSSAEGPGGTSDKKKETDMLKELLSSKSITSAISHDSIMNAEPASDGGVSRQEAEAIARKAAAALKLSAQQRLADPVNVPTWTGRAGLGGAPAVVREREAAVRAAGGAAGGAAKPRFGTVKKSSVKVGVILGSLDGPSLKDAPVAADSPHLDSPAQAAGGLACRELDKERGFGGAATCGIIGARIPEDDDAGENWALVTMRDLSDFLSKRYNPPTTGEILDRFRERVPQHRQELFRTCLKQVAEVEKREKLAGVWWIRDAFRTCPVPKRASRGDARQRSVDVGSSSGGCGGASRVAVEGSSKEAGKRPRSSSAGGRADKNDPRGSSASKRPLTSAEPNALSTSALADARTPLIVRIKTEAGAINGGASMKQPKKAAIESAGAAAADKTKAACKRCVDGENAGCGESSTVSNISLSTSSCSDNSDMADIAAARKKQTDEVQKVDVIEID